VLAGPTAPATVAIEAWSAARTAACAEAIDTAWARYAKARAFWTRDDDAASVPRAGVAAGRARADDLAVVRDPAGRALAPRDRPDADGDHWAFDWLDAPSRDDAPARACCFHGLEGGATSPYAVALMEALAEAGWRGVVPHFRGCGGLDNRRPRAYHLGDHEEVGRCSRRCASASDRTRRSTRPACRSAAPRCSTGSGAKARGRPRRSRRAAAVSTPHDIVAAGHSIDRGANRFYGSCSCAR
jgi:hypothetical protein